MKEIVRRFAPALAVLIFSCVAFGDDFKSQTIRGGGHSEPIRVHNDQFMVVRNFTQEGGSDRGFISVTKPPGSTDPMDTVQVLTAAILDPTSLTTIDVINNVVIAGPADVVFNCGTTTGSCFVSYKKDSN